jgi:hypothetical protein
MNNALKSVMRAAWMALVWMVALLVWAQVPAQASTGQLAMIDRTPEPASLLLAGMALLAIGAAMKKTQRKT